MFLFVVNEVRKPECVLEVLKSMDGIVVGCES
jgi:hypothetical protein